MDQEKSLLLTGDGSCNGIKTLFKKEIPIAYHLDMSALEEINFYMDPPNQISILKEIHK